MKGSFTYHNSDGKLNNTVQRSLVTQTSLAMMTSSRFGLAILKIRKTISTGLNQNG